MKTIRFDIGEFRKPKKTAQGYLRADAYATRAGIFNYRRPDGTIQKEFRPAEEVFKDDSLESLAQIPLTNDHPPEMVRADNSKSYSIGLTGEKVERDDDFVKVSLTVLDADAVKVIEEGRKVELSCGYTCDMDETPGEYNGQKYDAVQRNIVYNHLALVEKGRAGSEVRVRMDSAQAGMTYEKEKIFKKSKEGETKMALAKLKIDSVEYELPEGVAKVVSDKVSELDNLKKDHDALSGRYDSLKLEAEKKDKEIEDLKKSQPDRKACIEMAKKRLDLEALAKPVLGEEVKLDSLSDLEIKKNIITKVNSELKLDGKSDEYVDGCFEILKGSLKKDEGEDLKKTLGNSLKGDSDGNPNKARQASMKRDSELWKPAQKSA